ncbi:MAG: hypothetical protein ACQGTM_15645 [bacterium]
MMFCKNCGAEIQGGKFCSECGAPVSQGEIKPPEKVETDFSVHLGADKYYKKNEKVINVALKHNVISDPEKIVIYAGTYYSNLDCYFMFVCLDELIFCKINEKKPENDIITRLNYSNPSVSEFYDPKTYKFKISEDLIGFNPQKVIAYIPTLQVIYNEVQRLCGKEYSIPEPQKSFWQKTVEQGREINHKKELQKASQPKPLSKKERIKENKANGVACCPKCGSTSLSANKKGFGVGKALLGASATMLTPLGPLGAVAGNAGAKKVIITCLNCGHQWKP